MAQTWSVDGVSGMQASEGHVLAKQSMVIVSFDLPSLEGHKHFPKCPWT